MCIMLDMPPAMEQEAKDLASVQGTTLERMLLDHIEQDLARRRMAKETMSKLDHLVEKTSRRLNGKSYVFNRADAYEPEACLA